MASTKAATPKPKSPKPVARKTPVRPSAAKPAAKAAPSRAAPSDPAAGSIPQKLPDFVRAVGRRKEAVARVRLFLNGAGTITINNQDFLTYFPTFDYQYVVTGPLKLVGLDGKVDVRVKAQGGGKFGQAEATRHGIARALLLVDPDYRKQLRPAGYLTRDSRVKERKKPGLKKARRAPQFSKR